MFTFGHSCDDNKHVLWLRKALPKDVCVQHDMNKSLLNLSLLIWIYFHFIVIFPRVSHQEESKSQTY